MLKIKDIQRKRMNGHFSKPIDFDEMEKELGQFFSRRDIDEKNI